MIQPGRVNLVGQASEGWVESHVRKTREEKGREREVQTSLMGVGRNTSGTKKKGWCRGEQKKTNNRSSPIRDCQAEEEYRGYEGVRLSLHVLPRCGARGVSRRRREGVRGLGGGGGVGGVGGGGGWLEMGGGGGVRGVGGERV